MNSHFYKETNFTMKTRRRRLQQNTNCIENTTMIESNSNQNQYPIFVARLFANETSDEKIANEKEEFQMILPPFGYESFCESIPFDVMVENASEQTTSKLYKTALLIKSEGNDTSITCDIGTKIYNVMAYNSQLSTLSIDYIVLPTRNISNESNDILTAWKGIIDTIESESSMEINGTPVDNMKVILLAEKYHNKIYDQMLNSTELMNLNMTNNDYFSHEPNENRNFTYFFRSEKPSSCIVPTTANTPKVSIDSTSNINFITFFNVGFILIIVAVLIQSYRTFQKLGLQEDEEERLRRIQIQQAYARCKEIRDHRLSEQQFDALIKEIKYEMKSNEVSVVSDSIPPYTTRPALSETDSSPCQKTDLNTKMEQYTSISDDIEANNGMIEVDLHESNVTDVENPEVKPNIATIFVDDCCPICLDDFIYGEMVAILPQCEHKYHKICIREWLITKRGCCPLCKVFVVGD